MHCKLEEREVEGQDDDRKNWKLEEEEGEEMGQDDDLQG